MGFNCISESLADNLDFQSKEIAKGYSQKLNITIRSNILFECIDTCDSSLAFHDLTPNDINAYKVVAHFSFWFAKLKPLSYKFKESGTQYECKEDREDDLIIKTKYKNGDLLRDEPFLLNETVAFEIAHNSIIAHQTLFLEDHKGDIKPAERTAFEREIDQNREKLAKLQRHVASSLRQNNHSCRSWALFLESLYKTSYEWSNGK